MLECVRAAFRLGFGLVLSTATQVKVLSPVIVIVAAGTDDFAEGGKKRARKADADFFWFNDVLDQRG